MRERPILFSGPLVRAILEGRKTQTRRPMKPQPDYSKEYSEWWWPSAKCQTSVSLKDARSLGPFGKPGDRLWVKETWAVGSIYDSAKPSLVNAGAKVAYVADARPKGLKLRPSIFMTRWASRIDLEVTGVRVERVQDITESDAKAEGSQRFDERFPDMPEQRLTTGERGFDSPHRSGFAVAWDEHYVGSWMRNDWTWVIDFRRIEQ